MKHTLSVPGRYEKIQQICRFVADGAVAIGLSETAVFHIELACDEACTNIIEHAYGGEDIGDIAISWQVNEDEFIISIYDNGRAFDPDAIPSPPLLAKSEAIDKEMIEDLKVGGLGVHFIRKLMDNVQFHFGEQGNTLILVKKITSE